MNYNRTFRITLMHAWNYISNPLPLQGDQPTLKLRAPNGLSTVNTSTCLLLAVGITLCNGFNQLLNEITHVTEH